MHKRVYFDDYNHISSHVVKSTARLISLPFFRFLIAYPNDRRWRLIVQRVKTLVTLRVYAASPRMLVLMTLKTKDGSTVPYVSTVRLNFC